MKIELQQLNNAITGCIRPLLEAQSSSTLDSILFEFNNNSLSIRYSDGKNSVIKNIDVESESDDLTEPIVINYKQLTSAISLCASGQLKISDCRIVFNSDKKTLTLSVVKSYEYVVDGETVAKPVSKFQQEIGWAEPTSSMRYSLLTRIDYNKLFIGDGDIWDKATLKNILNKLTIDRSKGISISSKKGIAFVNSLKFASIIPVEEISNTIILTNKSAKALFNILSKIDSDTVTIAKTEDGKFITITDGDTIGIQFETGSVSTLDVNTIADYSNKEYTDYKLKFIREALVNVIDAVMTTDKTDKQNISFKENEDGEIELIIKANNNEYSVVVSGKVDNREEVLSLSVPISMEIIKDMLALCEQDYITLYMQKQDNKIIVRVGDLNLEKTESPDNLVHNIETYTIFSVDSK